MIIFQKNFIQDILRCWSKSMNGGLVYIIGILLLQTAIHFVVSTFILNTLCLYLFNSIKYTKRFINFRFILGEFVGGFMGYIMGGYLYKFGNNRSIDFEDIVFLVLFAIALSFVLLVLNMFLLTIRYRVFEKSRYESLLNSHSKKLWLRKSFIFGICFSFLFICIWIILFAIWYGKWKGLSLIVL